jgi:YVTN family beta-propeller protein
MTAGAVSALLAGLSTVAAPAAFGSTSSATDAVGYVTNVGNDTVSVVNTGTDTVVGNPIPVGSEPHGVTFAPNGSVAYVANSGENTVSVLDSTTGTERVITVGSSPWAVAFNPAGTYALVTNYSSNNVSVIDTATETVTKTIGVGQYPMGVAFNPAGTTAYVADDYFGTVSVIDTSTWTVTNTINVNGEPTDVVFSPSGAFAYVTQFGNESYGAVAVIDTATLGVTEINDIPYAWGLALTPDGSTLYVAERDPANAVAVIDTATNEVTSTLTGTALVDPIEVTMNTSGTEAYVTASSAVVTIDTSANTLGAVSDPSSSFSGGPWAMAMSTSVNYVQLSPPETPNAPTASSVKGGVSLTWTDNGSGDAQIIGHEVQVFLYKGPSHKNPTATYTLVKTIDTNSPDLSYTVTHLTGKQYAFEVAAVTVIGTSAYSDMSNVVKG